MSCVLRVGGRRFDVDRCLSKVRLRVLRVRRRGVPFSQTTPNSPKDTFSNCNILVSNRDFSEFPAQVRDAARFLQRNRKVIRYLRDFPGVQWATLDFGVELRDTAVHCDLLPSNLLLSAGTLGLAIEVSHYPPSERRRPVTGKAARRPSPSERRRRRTTA